MPLILDSPLPSPTLAIPPTEDERATRRTQHHSCDAVVVGAGILGTAIAITLARQNRSVILLERSLKEPDRIVGELLQPGGCEALERLGLRHCLEEIDAVKVHGYEVIYHGKEVAIPYPKEAVSKSLPNPGQRPEGRSFHHGRFIRRLRETAMLEPNLMVVETTVTGTIRSTWTNTSGPPKILGIESLTHGVQDYYFGDLTIIADGYASKFRKEYIPHSPISRSKFWGLELRDADLPLPQHGHVILGDHPPILLYQIGTHETRALVDIPEGIPSASPAAGGPKAHLRNVVLPALPKCVQSSFEIALDEGKLRSMPNSWLPPSTNRVPGMIMLGDAMNMRHPLTGGGMTVALNDVVLLRDLLGPEQVPSLSDTNRVLSQMKKFHWRRKNLTSVINILAQALYSLFAANDPQLLALQLACFRYFELGGSCIDGPVGLLAGIIRQPLVLFYHFFSVALLGMWIVVSDAAPAWKKPWAVLESVLIFAKAVGVIGPFIWSEVRS
ncbi:Squalene epoxidase [Bachmanniomyces sp. S44760]|nr:Squalene epoxidase [Bachmanniomyces sp. S44760]